MIIQRTSNDLHEAIIHTMPGAVQAALETLYQTQARKMPQKRMTRPAIQRWVCEVCGMPHNGPMPDACESCGRTDALVPERHPRTEMFSRG